MTRSALLFTCEHASAAVPPALRPALRGAKRALASHRGVDHGALSLARTLARASGAPLYATRLSRLVVDANRSEHHPRLLSEWTHRLPAAERRRLVERFWRPHRRRVEQAVAGLVADGARVVHVGVHTFTPRWRGRQRNVDVALLYDPARPLEKAFAGRWLRALARRRPALRLRRNHPYRGTADGLTASLRRRFAPRAYLGLELEVSQAFPLAGGPAWRALRRDLARSLLDALGRS